VVVVVNEFEKDNYHTIGLNELEAIDHAFRKRGIQRIEPVTRLLLAKDIGNDALCLLHLVSCCGGCLQCVTASPPIHD
jgi:hypothetical protein